jgi:hypothetical protein
VQTEIPRPVLRKKKALVVGIANEHSIAYGCAKAFREVVCRVGYHGCRFYLRFPGDSLWTPFNRPDHLCGWGNQYHGLGEVMHKISKKSSGKNYWINFKCRKLVGADLSAQNSDGFICSYPDKNKS